MKNKKLISTVAALAIATTMMPVSIFADTVSNVVDNNIGIENTVDGEQVGSVVTTPDELATEKSVSKVDEFNSAIADSSVKTINLLDDITLSESIDIDRELTINGNSHNITYIGASKTNLFNVSTDKNFTINNLKGDITNGRFIGLSSNSPHLYLNSGEFYVKERGISFVQDGYAENAEVILDNTKIRCTAKVNKDGDYDKDTAVGDIRGISIFDVRNSEITLKNGSELSGFGYVINVSGNKNEKQIIDTSGLKVNVIDSKLRGWTGFNVWGAFADYNIENSYILGINNSNGKFDSFSAMVFNNDAYNQFDGLHAYSNKLYIKDTTITNYQNNPEDLITNEELLRIDNGLSKLSFAGDVKFIDTTGKISTGLYLGLMSEDESEEINRNKFLNENIFYENAKLTFKTEKKGGMKLANEISTEIIDRNGCNKFFTSLQKAVESANRGDTIKLIEDINILEK